MEIEKWSDIAPSFISTPVKIYKNRHALQNWWKHFLVYIEKGDTNVVVLGRPNVGKSVMAAYLYGETNNLEWQLPQTSFNVESKPLTLGKWTKIVRVIPGQTMEERYIGLKQSIANNKQLEGFIYVVDWGYTDIRSESRKRDMIKTRGMASIEDLRNFNLKAELEDFKKVCEWIRSSFSGTGTPPKWLLIIVNKCDLFFESQKLNLAQDYYNPKGSSEFSKVLQKTWNDIGKQNFKCHSIPLCSFEADMIWNKEKVKTNIGGEQNRKALARNFFNVVANF